MGGIAQESKQTEEITNSRPKTEIDTRSPTDSRVSTILEQINEGSVLDVGCVQHDADKETDPNWLHQHLYACADEVLGLDYLEKDVEKLAEQGYNVTFGDAENLSLSRRFDTIVAGELIEHLSNPGSFLDCCREHLVDDGQLILTTPNVWGVTYLKRLLFAGEVHCNEEHACWYDRRTLRQLLERHGFDVEIEFVKPQNTSSTPIPQMCWHLRMKRLGALSLIAIATPADE